MSNSDSVQSGSSRRSSVESYDPSFQGYVREVVEDMLEHAGDIFTACHIPHQSSFSEKQHLLEGILDTVIMADGNGFQQVVYLQGTMLEMDILAAMLETGAIETPVIPGLPDATERPRGTLFLSTFSSVGDTNSQDFRMPAGVVVIMDSDSCLSAADIVGCTVLQRVMMENAGEAQAQEGRAQQADKRMYLLTVGRTQLPFFGSIGTLNRPLVLAQRGSDIVSNTPQYNKSLGDVVTPTELPPNMICFVDGPRQAKVFVPPEGYKTVFISRSSRLNQHPWLTGKPVPAHLMPCVFLIEAMTFRTPLPLPQRFAVSSNMLCRETFLLSVGDVVTHQFLDDDEAYQQYSYAARDDDMGPSLLCSYPDSTSISIPAGVAGRPEIPRVDMHMLAFRMARHGDISGFPGRIVPQPLAFCQLGNHFCQRLCAMGVLSVMPNNEGARPNLKFQLQPSAESISKLLSIPGAATFLTCLRTAALIVTGSQLSNRTLSRLIVRMALVYACRGELFLLDADSSDLEATVAGQARAWHQTMSRGAIWRLLVLWELGREALASSGAEGGFLSYLPGVAIHAKLATGLVTFIDKLEVVLDIRVEANVWSTEFAQGIDVRGRLEVEECLAKVWRFNLVMVPKAADTPARVLHTQARVSTPLDSSRDSHWALSAAEDAGEAIGGWMLGFSGFITSQKPGTNDAPVATQTLTLLSTTLIPPAESFSARCRGNQVPTSKPWTGWSDEGEQLE